LQVSLTESSFGYTLSVTGSFGSYARGKYVKPQLYLRLYKNFGSNH
jgi:hypothetical protein